MACNIKLLLGLSGILFLNSCATLFAPYYKPLEIKSKEPNVQVCIWPDTTKFFNTPHIFKVPSSRNDVILIAKNDSIKQVLTIPSRIGGAFWFGNLFTGYPPIAYALDLSNDKRFNYPPKYNVPKLDGSKPKLKH